MRPLDHCTPTWQYLAMAKETRSIMLRIRIEPSLKAKLEKAATADRRTLSDWVRLLLERAVADEIVKPDKPRRK